MARARRQLDFRALAEALTAAHDGPPDMAQIARRLGVAKPTLYRMAGSRDELIAISIDAEAERLLDALHTRGPAGFFEFAEQDRAGLLLLFGGLYPQARAAVRRVEARVRQLLAEPAAGGPADPAATAAAFVAAAAAIALRDPRAGAERLSSDFDAAAKSLAVIFDPRAVGGGPGQT